MFVQNSAVRACCGRPAAECRCQDFASATYRPVQRISGTAPLGIPVMNFEADSPYAVANSASVNHGSQRPQRAAGTTPLGIPTLRFD